jgi:hypothetical protein
MRTKVGIVLVTASLALSGPARADDREKALAVIERAIKAQGGAEALNKAQSRSRTGQGKLAVGGDLPFTTEETVQLPGRSRTVLEAGGRRQIVVLNGDKGWILPLGGAAQELNKDFFEELREEPYVWWLMTLTPLQKDGFELKVLPDAKVKDQDAAVVKVSSKGHPDATLFFDKRTDLLIKIARRAKQAGVPLNKEYYYSDYKEFDGVRLPAKELITLNGKPLSEVTFTRYRLLSRIEDSTFGKP